MEADAASDSTATATNDGRDKTGRGRQAAEFRAGWAARLWPVVRQSTRDVWANNLMEWAAALAFYALLSLFPLGLALVAAASWAVEPGWAAARLDALLQSFVPQGVIDLEPIVATAVEQRGRVGLLAVLSWVFAGRRILGALTTALNQVSDVDPRRVPLVRKVLTEAGLMGGLASLFAVALSAGTLLDILWGATADAGRSPLQAAVTAVAQVALLVATFYAIYTFVPHGERNRRAALLGAIVAAALFLLARAVFLAVVDRLWASFDLIYGPLALGALLLFWAWYVGMVVLFGGSLASHAKSMLVEGHSAHEAERRHVARKAA